MKFGTSGLRGLVEDIEGVTAAVYATAFARHLVASGSSKLGDLIFIGGDHRPSSPDIAATCIGALARAGLVPIDCGALPTPALALFAMSQGCASLMVTGSHIPADRNGIKFYRPDGEIDKADEQAITRYAAEIRESLIDLTPGVAPSQADKARAAFLMRVEGILPPGSLSGLKIGVYQHSTVAREQLVEVIEGYGAEVVALGHSDTFIPVDTEAVSPATIDLMTSWARAHDLDAIVSADGDGDRPLVADETGQSLRGDLLGLMVAQLLEAGTVVTPVTSNSGIEQAGHFAVVRTRVGSPFVIEAMNKALAAGEPAILGFEANGGVLTATDFEASGRTIKALPTRDSFLPILAALLRRAQENKPFSVLAASFGLPVAAADRLENFPLEASAALMAHLKGSRDNLASWLAPIGEIAAINEVDGLRITLSDQRILHLRPSGNAPEMRCYVEAHDEEGAQHLLSQGLDLIKAWTSLH